jgi:hypothetical protein
MKDWDIFAWIAYGAIAVSAVLLAVDQGIRNSPELLAKATWVIKGRFWGFFPAVSILLATVILIANQFGVVSLRRSDNRDAFIKWPTPYAPEFVINRTFHNQEVALDGFSYTGCKFYNVTFVYNGTTPVQFSNNEVYGSWIKTDNPAISGAVLLLKGLGYIPKEVPIDLPQDSLVTPPTKTP